MLQKCTSCTSLTHFIGIHVLIACACIPSVLFGTGESLDRSWKEWKEMEVVREYGHINITLYSCCYIMCGGQRICQPCTVNQSQTWLLHLVSHISKIVICSYLLHLQQYILQLNISIIPFRSSGLLQSGMKCNSRHQASASAHQTVKNIWEDVIIAFLPV